MPIPLPNLDDRRWTDLVDEARALIPVYASEWTDHNVSDPGITLLELLSFVTEGLLYRANRIPDSHRRLMLALAGVRPHGPAPARVLLNFTTDATRDIPAHTVCSGLDASGDPVLFRTTADLTAIPGSLTFSGDPAATLSITLSDPVPAGVPISIGFVVRGDGTSFAERDRILADSSPLEHHSVRLRWEALTTDWETIDTVADGTRSLVLDGVVTLTVPADTTAIRVSVASGEYDRTPEVFNVLLNAAEAEQTVESAPVPVAVATGDDSPFQRVALAGAPVIEDSVEVVTDDGPWERRDELTASRPSSRHFLLDSTRGEITFGDGNQGLTPALGTEIRIRHLWTRASNGAVGKDTVDKIVDASLEGVGVGNAAPSEGGSDEETLAQAIGRVRLLREASLRAVTLADMESIVIETPGAEIARASARANTYPGLACVQALGVITVIVVPASDSPRPQPSAGLLSYVSRRLERRRIIGTRIVVTGPEYVEVSVHARVTTLGNVRREAVRQRVLEALMRFFDPLQWPFGRDVYRSEVLQAIDGVEGVDFVEKLELSANGCGATCGNVCLPAIALVAEGNHNIEVIS